MDDVTIYSIAKETGVSPSTVSRVINNNPHVSKETRAKVLKALDAAGFVPNDAARNLVTKSSHMIGVLVSDIRETQQSNTVHTIVQTFTKKGYSCLIYNTGSSPDNLQTYMRQLTQKKVDGVVIMGTSFKKDALEKAVAKYFSKIPVIMVNGRLDNPNVYSIYCDMKAGIASSVDHLVEKGRRNIAYVYAYEHLGTGNLSGLIEEEIGKREGLSFVSMETERRPEEVGASITRLLGDHPEVDGIIFADDYLAIAGMRGLFDNGKTIPGDVSVIGISNSRYTRISNPRLTSLDTMLYDCALTAVRNMLQALQGEYAPKNMMMSPNLVVRESS